MVVAKRREPDAGGVAGSPWNDGICGLGVCDSCTEYWTECCRGLQKSRISQQHVQAFRECVHVFRMCFPHSSGAFRLGTRSSQPENPARWPVPILDHPRGWPCRVVDWRPSTGTAARISYFCPVARAALPPARPALRHGLGKTAPRLEARRSLYLGDLCSPTASNKPETSF